MIQLHKHRHRDAFERPWGIFSVLQLPFRGAQVFPRSFFKSATLSASLGYSGASQMALGSCVQTADQTHREEFSSGFRRLDLVNGGLVYKVKGRLIILKQTPAFTQLNNSLDFLYCID